MLYLPKEGERYSGQFSNVSPNGTALVRNAKGRHTGKKGRVIGFEGTHVRFYELDRVPLSECRYDNEDEKAPF